MSEFLVSEDRPGFCAKCHIPVAEFNGSNPETGNPIITKLLPNLRVAYFRLDNGSQMVVTLCQECYDVRPNEAGALMENIINGWQYEVDHALKDMDEDKKFDYMDKVSKFFITDRLDKRWNDDEVKQVTKPDKNNLRLKKKKGK